MDEMSAMSLQEHFDHYAEDFNNLSQESTAVDALPSQILRDRFPDMNFRDAANLLHEEVNQVLVERQRILQTITKVRNSIAAERAEQLKLLDSLLVLDDTLPAEFARRVEMRIAASTLELSKQAKNSRAVQTSTSAAAGSASTSTMTTRSSRKRKAT
eukprot:TRINITY_DN15963_c0_g1_i1.p1 TRINITY_DN15963_c0_g1~~TRINITY_DN15963_c0_g1_i1.p1  ORF type:complete len:169 (+),score=43.73 TRINITY_DN15963_c0_g1_i1:39-509(+)